MTYSKPCSLYLQLSKLPQEYFTSVEYVKNWNKGTTYKSNMIMNLHFKQFKGVHSLHDSFLMIANDIPIIIPNTIKATKEFYYLKHI